MKRKNLNCCIVAIAILLVSFGCVSSPGVPINPRKLSNEELSLWKKGEYDRLLATISKSNNDIKTKNEKYDELRKYFISSTDEDLSKQEKIEYAIRCKREIGKLNFPNWPKKVFVSSETISSVYQKQAAIALNMLYAKLVSESPDYFDIVKNLEESGFIVDVADNSRGEYDVTGRSAIERMNSSYAYTINLNASYNIYKDNIELPVFVYAYSFVEPAIPHSGNKVFEESSFRSESTAYTWSFYEGAFSGASYKKDISLERLAEIHFGKMQNYKRRLYKQLKDAYPDTIK